MRFALCGFSSAVMAREPIELFLEGLRSRGYHDTAVDYLEGLNSNSFLPDDERQALPYHQGATLMEAAGFQRDLAVRAQTLDVAQRKLDEFLSQHPEHALAGKARDDLRSILVLRARLALTEAKETSEDKAYGQAAALYDKAVDAYQNHREQLRDEIKAYQKDPRREKSIQDDIQSRYVDTVSQSALLQFEMTAALRNNEKKLAALKKAAEAFAEIAKKYRTWGAGVQAVYFQGRCQQEAGNLKEALAFYEQLYPPADSSPLGQSLATKSLTSSIKCWTEGGEFEHAIDQGETWIENGEPSNPREPVWEGFLMSLSQAYIKHAGTVQGDEQRISQTNARKILADLARRRGPNQTKARQLLTSLGGGAAANSDDRSMPTTYAEAKEAAHIARESMQSADVTIRLLTPKLAEKEGAEKTDLERQITEARRERDQARDRALQLYSAALRLAGRDMDVEELNELRYYLAYIMHTRGRYQESAVLAEFLARRFPSNAAARQCANIALASYLKLYSDDAARGYSINHVMQIAEYIVETWPQQKEGVDALVTLVSFMIQDGQWERASQFLERIPQDSPRRADAELRLGQSIWGRYLQGMKDIRAREANGSVSAAEKEQLETLKSRSQAVLSSGIARLREQPPNDMIVRAALSLAQVYVNSAQTGEALTLLEDPRIGPKTLADKKSPFTEGTGIAEQIYKTTLQAYIGSLADGGDRGAVLAKATDAMKSLEASVGETAKARGRLTAVYVSLAKDLREQIELAPLAQRAILSSGFDAFLSNVQKGTNEIGTLAWVAEMYFNLGQGLDSSTGNGPATQAKPYYEKANQAYARILEVGENADLDPRIRTKIQVQMARVQRKTGQYEAAIANFEQILTDQNMLLNVQIEAARTYQEGASSGQANWFNLAIKGNGGRKPTIWGWGRIGKIAASQMYRSPEQKERYRHTFHEARYNIARCRHDQATRSNGDDRTKYMKLARLAITSTAALYPDMGGQTWKEKYDVLMKDVQRALGEEPTGLNNSK